MSVSVPGQLQNPLNGSHRHWSQRYRWAKDWRTRTVAALQVHRLLHREAWGDPASLLGTPSTPKVVHFACRTWATCDDDALPAMVKPVRDALVSAGVLDTDAPSGGHKFTYSQTVDRRHRGVTILLRRAAPRSELDPDPWRSAMSHHQPSPTTVPTASLPATPATRRT